MNIEVIQGMISDSVWKNPENESVFQFSNDNGLIIDGKNKFQYTVISKNDKIELWLGTDKSYFIEYVNDFHLKLYNSRESFGIIPE